MKCNFPRFFKSMFLFLLWFSKIYGMTPPNADSQTAFWISDRKPTIPSVDPRPLSRLRIRSTVSSLGNCACFSTAYLFKYLTDRMQFGYQRLKGRFRRIMNIIFNNDNHYEEVSLQNKTFLEIFRDNLISPMFSSKNGALSITVCFKVRWIMRNSLPRARVVVETLNLAVFNSSFCKVRQ